MPRTGAHHGQVSGKMHAIKKAVKFTAVVVSDKSFHNCECPGCGACLQLTGPSVEDLPAYHELNEQVASIKDADQRVVATLWLEEYRTAANAVDRSSALSKLSDFFGMTKKQDSREKDKMPVPIILHYDVPLEEQPREYDSTKDPDKMTSAERLKGTGWEEEPPRA